MQGGSLDNVKGEIRQLALENAAKHSGSARWETVLTSLLVKHPELRAVSADAAGTVKSIVAEVNALSPDEIAAIAPKQSVAKPRAQSTEEKHELPELPGASKGNVVLRFAPFPSGALHLGSARGVFINDEYRKRYDGKFYLVFDDTIGSEEKKPLNEGYDLVMKDFENLGIKPDAVFYKSDRLEHHYSHVPDLLEGGFAYVCTCPAEVLRGNRERSIACEERDRAVEWQQEAWEGMLEGKYSQGEAVVRLKTSLADPNPAFRDRVLLRISEEVHPRVGSKYRVWPLLEYSWAIDDVDLGITHVIRGKDLQMEDQMEEALWKALGIKGPTFTHWGLLRVREAKISKSKSYKEVMSGLYDGWTDPRTWSFGSLSRRGIRMSAVRSFVLSFGMSLADIEVPAETLYTENRRILDPITARRAFAADPILVQVEAFPKELGSVELPNHPDNEGMGKRTLDVREGSFYLQRKDLERSLGKEIRLKELANIELPPSILEGKVKAKFTSMANKPIPRIQWVPVKGAQEVSVLMPDGVRVAGMGESTLTSLDEGDIFQFERFGFVRADNQLPEGPKRFVFAHT